MIYAIDLEKVCGNSTPLNPPVSHGILIPQGETRKSCTPGENLNKFIRPGTDLVSEETMLYLLQEV